MALGETNGLTPGHTQRNVCCHGEVVHGDRGTRGSEVSLLQCSLRGHPPRAHLSQSRGARNSAPTAGPCDVPYVEAGRDFRRQVESGGAFTANRKMLIDIVVRRGSRRDASNREYREKSILLDVTHADPQAQIHLRGGRADHDGSAASTFEAHKHQLYPRPRHVSFDERSHEIIATSLRDGSSPAPPVTT